ncbi:intraflagellar transport protein 20 homolog isoform X1 [Rana temporaria]|uniref:intraflagellar transport protein 20 homolog isoform X1 n=1 Tax=Rana temporaria TaxID=8407 RepID=UPI001AACF5A0|nr:intraflagellar transport protein 20 homolog isoform X1 [Rana temporaria]
MSVNTSRLSPWQPGLEKWERRSEAVSTAMAKDSLSEAGLHFDELNKLRILDPDVSQQTTELKEECREFVDKIGDFQKIVGGLIDMVDQLAKETENEKMKAIGARNLLKSISKQREAQQQQLHALIAEKKMQLERYQIEYEALCKVEAEQNEFIDQFILQK